ncbi:MAG: hypothetical protein IJP79_03310 [Paludibacteraceae bacterium]|nr:hypothetical protein [Paludibacteraceae bacterium]
MMDNLHKEIDLIQNCIDRMDKNSFMLKGWTISLIAVVLALTADRLNPLFLFCSIFVPVLCFWYLDAFFLRTEKMYRKMYEWVLKERKEGRTDFQYDLEPSRFKNQVDTHCRVMFSKTLRVFYGIPLLVVLFVILYNSRDIICCCFCGC